MKLFHPPVASVINPWPESVTVPPAAPRHVNVTPVVTESNDPATAIMLPAAVDPPPVQPASTEAEDVVNEATPTFGKVIAINSSHHSHEHNPMRPGDDATTPVALNIASEASLSVLVFEWPSKLYA